MKVVKIQWIDSCASNMNWSLLNEFDGDIEPIKIISYGVLSKRPRIVLRLHKTME